MRLVVGRMRSVVTSIYFRCKRSADTFPGHGDGRELSSFQLSPPQNNVSEQFMSLTERLATATEEIACITVAEALHTRCLAEIPVSGVVVHHFYQIILFLYCCSVLLLRRGG